VGLNATRLATMFALPVVCAYTPLPRWRSAAGASSVGSAGSTGSAGLAIAAGLAGLAALAGWQPPVLLGDLRDAGNPTASPNYYAPLLAELQARAPAGRVEIPPTRDYWEAAYVARETPLARGWLRQADLARNPLFFDGTLNASRYGQWLRDTGVSYVALPDATLSWVGRREAALIAGGLPDLTPVWRGDHWTLYAVAGGTPSIVDGARLVATGPDTVSLDADRAGTVLVRVRYSRWLSVRSGPPGARLSAGPDGWTTLRVSAPGRYTFGS
jgi:hypothetical protein